MCIGSNSVNQAQDLMTVTKIEDLPNSLLPSAEIATSGRMYLVPNTTLRGPGMMSLCNIFILG